MRPWSGDEDTGGSGRAAARVELGRNLVPARLIGRSGRFSVTAEIDGPRGKECARAHLPNSGRLTEVLQPGAELRLRRAHAAGVQVIACRCTVTPDAVLAYDRRVPVRLEEARR